MQSESKRLLAALQAAAAAETSGSLDAAANAYREVLDLDSNHALALRKLGRIHIRQGRFAEAAPLLERCVQKEPRSAEGHLLRAVGLQGLQEFPAAIREYEAAIEIEPSAGALTNLGGLLVDSARPTAALRSLDRALALESTHGAAHYHRGRALQQLGKRDA